MDATQAPQGGGGSGGRKEKNQNIQVYVRVRPMNTQETAKHATEVIDTPGTREVVVKERTSSNLSKTFTFDRVFGARSRQIDVYKVVVSPLLAEVLLGYNCTVFAYGQTGTGKTFTMEGERKANSGIENDPNAGILPRALSELFDELRLMNCEFSVRASFLELYNEELFDLLAPIDETKAKTLRLFEDATRKGSVIIQGLEEVIVNNKHEVYAVLDKGTQQRKTAATLMNATSSRSHTVFTITVHIKESSVEGEEMVKVGKLHLVDLAGSENIGKSGAVDKRAREAGSINQSLLTLGRVISALVERTPHVPYRESKLTRLLQDSLGGKTKTSIIATISPAVTNIEETLSTLDYAHRAKNIMNRPEVNQKISKKEAITMYTDEIERLRRDLNAARDKNGIFLDHDNYTQMVCQIDSQHHELNEKSNKIRELEECLTKREDEVRDAMDVIEDLKLDIQTKQTILDSLTTQKKALESNLNVSNRKNDELKHLLKYHEVTEEKMSSEANTLLHTANDTVSIIEALHGRLERKQQVEQTNWKNGERFRDEFRQTVNEIIESVNEIKQSHTIGISNIRDLLNTRATDQKEGMEAYTIMFYDTTSKVETLQNGLGEACARFNAVTKMHHESTNAYIKQESANGMNKLGANMTSLSSSLENLNKQFLSVKEDLTTLQNVIAVKFDGMNKLVMDSLKANVQRFNNTEKALTAFRDKWSSAVELIFSKCSTFYTEQEKFKADHKLKIAKLCESLYQLRSETESHLTETFNTFSFINNKLETTNKETSSEAISERNNIRAARIPAEALLKKAADFRAENVVNHQLTLGRMQDRMGAVEPCFVEIKTRAENMSKDFSEGFSGATAKVANMNKETLFELDKIDNQVFEILDAQFQEIGGLKSESHQQFKRTTDGEDKCIENLVQHMDQQCDIITTGCTEVTGCLAHTSGAVDEFWEETYLTDNRTGATPMRKKFEFPTSLSMPSPHSRVIARYRNNENNVQTEIDNCVEESDTSTSTLADDKMSQQGDALHENEENKDPQSESKQTKETQVATTTESSEEKSPPKEIEQKESMVVQTPSNKNSAEEGKKVENQQVDAKKTGKQGKKNGRSKRKSGGGQKGVLKAPN